MTELKNLLGSFLNQLVSVDSPDIRIGCNKFYLTYDQSSQAINPLQIQLFTDPDNNQNPSVINYMLSGKTNKRCYVRRIRQTPFYINQYDNDDSGLQIIDFYQWQPKTTIFRLLYYQSGNQNSRIDIFLPPVLEIINENILQLKKAFLGYFSSGNCKYEENILSFFGSGKNYRSELLVTALAANYKELEKLTLEKILATLTHLIAVSRKNHIQNSIRIQDLNFEKEIDDLWQREKNITPDLIPDLAFIQKSENSWNQDFWIGELFRLLGWHFPHDDFKKYIRSEIKHDIHKTAIDKVEDILIANYESDQHFSKGIQLLLQQWWDHYSLPLFSVKIENKLQTHPDELFIIYFLALRHRMYWQEHLYRLCNKFENWPILALLAKIYHIFVIDIKDEKDFTFSPGYWCTGNRKEFWRGKLRYKLTRYGQKVYSILALDNQELVKIDQEVDLNFNQSENVISILPMIKDIKLRYNLVTLIIGDMTLKLPLIWKKTEITFLGLRLRYIFKKDRFQLTFQRKKNNGSIEINGEKLTFDGSSKLVRYIPVKPMVAYHSFSLFDQFGRTYHLSHRDSRMRCILYGWQQDKFGILIEKLNVRFDSKQLICGINHTGIFTAQITIPTHIDHVQIAIRKINTIVSKGRSIDPVMTKLLSYSLKNSDGYLVVVVDEKIENEINSIKRVIKSILGFQPYYILKSEIKGKLSCQPLVFISAIGNQVRIEDKSDFSNRPFLSIGINQGEKAIISAFSSHDVVVFDKDGARPNA